MLKSTFETAQKLGDKKVRRLTLEQARQLEDCCIVQFKGISGVASLADVAAQAPWACQMHTMSGAVYNLEFDGFEFILTEA